ncbi:hypothetical protein CAPTEDRAFT_187362 [Capitella teleta]|uniref:THAP-type domain-containing protein n=1 Tax=Capitella teleta TaxID=283909 RepID=X1ZK65_CAPTE|nr:hypothetical protein CAPTEDRAFT_187362 [Capitella teleta]|eukprot:ELU10187.1 hypothetical protein CAPTEDRAFT_187362 [Capitella teleta]
MDRKKCSTSVEEGPKAKNKNIKSGMTYFCVIHCSANCKTIYEFTGQEVKMHKLPDAVRHRERCLKWIAKLGRADLSINNVNTCTIKVCSKHFEQKAYMCSTDIAKSLLLPRAFPSPYNSELSKSSTLSILFFASSSVKWRRVAVPVDFKKNLAWRRVQQSQLNQSSYHHHLGLTKNLKMMYKRL